MSRPRLLIIDGVPSVGIEDSDLYFWYDENQEGILELVLENSSSELRQVILESDFLRIS